MNPTEHVFSWLSRTFYQGKGQFDSVADNTEAVMHSWVLLLTKKLRKLIRLMPKRCGEVLVRKNEATHYTTRN